MEDSSDFDMTPSKVLKHKSFVKEDKQSVKKPRGDEHEIIIPNGTGTNPHHSSEMEPVNDKPKTIKITKITKVKTGESKSPHKKEQNTSITAQEKSPSSPSADDGFCGFECLTLNKEQIKKQDALLRILDQLNASCSKAKEEPENQREKDSEEIEENGLEEDMTVDTGHVSDAVSDQMEIDIEKDKDTSSLSDRPQERTKDSDVDSIKSAEDKISKSDVSEIKVAVTDTNKAAESPAPESSRKGNNTKVEFCGTCDAEVNDAEEGICCDGDCERWFHLRCSGLTQAEYDELGLDENAKWACSKCSGKPPRPATDIKPLLTVRKDLGQFSTPSPLLLVKKRSATREGRSPKIDISNPAFLKPFDFGWKRELVYRSTNDSQNRRQGDIYYYTPKGKKLRSLREICDHLIGTDLTQDNFTFWKEPLGIDDPEKEIIRDAKFKLVNKDSNASPASVVKKPLTPKTPKTPKITPKLTATVTPLESTGALKASASVTPRVVLKGKASPATGPKFKVTPSKTTTPGQTQKIVISKDKKRKTVSDDELEMGMLPPMWDSISKPKEKVAGTRTMDVCSIRCLPAMGLIPTLQCHVCLCLYHPECVGLEEANHRTIHSYKCKNCQMEKPKPSTGNNSKSILPPPPLTPINTLNPPIVGISHPSHAPPKLQRMMDGKPNSGPRSRIHNTKTSSIVGGVTTWLPPSSTIQLRPPPPSISKFSPSQKPLPPTTTAMMDSAASQPVQTLVSMDCKRYIVVPKHNVLSVSPATTSSVQVADPVSSTQMTTAASDPNNTMALTQAYMPGKAILPKPQVPTSTAFIVNNPSSTPSTFQNPPGVLLVPYISPQTTASQKDNQQPQYFVVNGPSGLQAGNFIIGNIPQQQQLKLPAVPTSQPAEPPLESAGVKRPLEDAAMSPEAKRAKSDNAIPTSVMQNFMQNIMQNMSQIEKSMIIAFQYLKVQELLRASRVCNMWNKWAFDRKLWETVRMKNSQVKDWEGFSATLRKAGTKHLDLRKILMPDKQDALKVMWSDCVKALSKVNTLLKLDLCRCTSYLFEQIAAACPQLECMSAGTIKSSQVNLTNLGNCPNLTELKLKGQCGMDVNNVAVLGNLNKLKQLSLTTIKNINEVLEVVGKMPQLEALELGDLCFVNESIITESFSQLTKLKRLRLEKGQQDCPTEAILTTIAKLPSLVQLELINFDVKAGFEEALGLCENIKILLIIPTYVTQSATTNHIVIEGVSKLSKTLNHFVWGLTLELLRVTDLFIDQWEMGQKSTGAKNPNQMPSQKKSTGDSIPILKPTVKDKPREGGVTQVDVLQLPKLHKVLTALLPTTKIIILKVPFSATWRQTISNSSQ